MTLKEWVRAGGNMLSDYTRAYCCNILQIPTKKLREMPLEDIFRIPGAGEVAKREILRFATENKRQLVGAARQWVSEYTIE